MKYIYEGEGEVIVPFTLDGPKVVSNGDTVNVPDEDWNAAGFRKVEDAPAPKAIVAAPAPATPKADDQPADPTA